VAGLDDLSRGELADILRRLRQLETASPLQNASIGSSGLRVYGGGVITIENGGLKVTGSAEIIGALIASGTIAFTGTLTQSGPSTFTGDTKLNGPTHINGATDITGATTVTGDMTSTGTFTNNGPTNLNGATKTTGTLSVEGATSLKSDLTVASGKKIILGTASLENQAGAGVLKLGGTTFTAQAGTGTAVQSDGVIHLYGSGIELGTIANAPAGATANLRVDPTTGTLQMCS